MDTPLCTAELKLMMMKPKDNRHEVTNNVEQFSLMNKIKEEEQCLGLRILRITVSNSDMGTRTIKKLVSRMISARTETEFQTDSFIQMNQATLGTLDPKTDSKLSITSMPDQRLPTVSTIRTFHRATTYLHPTQFNLLTIKDKVLSAQYQDPFP